MKNEVEFRIEFTQTITQLIKDQQQREITSQIQQQNLSGISSGSNKIQVSNRSNIDNLTGKDRSFYDYISSQHGIQEFYNWLNQKTRLLFSAKVNESLYIEPLQTLQKQSDYAQNEDFNLDRHDIDEIQMIIILKEIFNDILENRVYQFFEMIEFNTNFRVGFQQFYLILAFFASIESNQSMDFLYTFGSIVFNLIGNEKQSLLGSRLHLFAQLIGFPEQKISKAFNELKFTVNKEYSYDEFQLFFSMLFLENEISSKSSGYPSIPNSPIKTGTINNPFGNFSQKDTILQNDQLTKLSCNIF